MSTTRWPLCGVEDDDTLLSHRRSYPARKRGEAAEKGTRGLGERVHE